MTSCIICEQPFETATSNARTKRFCSDPCRALYHRACRHIGEHMVEMGIVSLDEVRRRAKDSAS